MSRATDEWIGKDDGTVPPPRVRLRVFDAAGGRCHLCSRKISAGEYWQCDNATIEFKEPRLEPRELPILMSGSMVRAILARRKRMTRRLALNPAGKPSTWAKARVGDTMWVREMFGYIGTCDPGFLLFGATWQDDAKRYGCENIPDKRPPMKPGIHMPRALCRLTLPLIEVHTEPLHAITDEDAIAEGVMQWDEPDKRWHYLTKDTGPYAELAWGNPRDAFQGLWESLHGRESWAANPEVVVLSFQPQ